MDGNSFFIDTNIVVEFFRGNKKVINYLNENKNLIISAIVLGELEFGVQNAKEHQKHSNQLRDFMIGVNVINIDKETAVWYGKIKTELRKSGKPIPENDIWIAALSMQHNLILITNDAHFDNVNSLKMQQI